MNHTSIKKNLLLGFALAFLSSNQTLKSVSVYLSNRTSENGPDIGLRVGLEGSATALDLKRKNMCGRIRWDSNLGGSGIGGLPGGKLTKDQGSAFLALSFCKWAGRWDDLKLYVTNKNSQHKIIDILSTSYWWLPKVTIIFKKNMATGKIEVYRTDSGEVTTFSPNAPQGKRETFTTQEILVATLEPKDYE